MGLCTSTENPIDNIYSDSNSNSNSNSNSTEEELNELKPVKLLSVLERERKIRYIQEILICEYRRKYIR